MEPETIKTIGAGAGSGILGVILAFFGLKSRINSIDRKLEHVVYDDTCKATVTGIEKQLNTVTDLLKEQRTDIKELLKK